MAELKNRVSLCIDDLEEMLGVARLPVAVNAAESDFFSEVDRIAAEIARNAKLRAVFISGPTASGKTTFTARMVEKLEELGRSALCFSLDNYYNVGAPSFDKDGRPDYESISTLDVALLKSDMRRLLAGEGVRLSEFFFGDGGRRAVAAEEVLLPKGAILLVEGLHGLAPEISGVLPREERAGIFLLPWGGLVSDARLLESRDVRLLRRLVRDARHRGSGALATIDYWPMVVQSEQSCFARYLRNADFYMNTMLRYEPLVTAAVALADIREDLRAYEEGRLAPSSFITKHRDTGDGFADIERALAHARMLTESLAQIPAADMDIVPDCSILNEFI